MTWGKDKEFYPCSSMAPYVWTERPTPEVPECVFWFIGGAD